MPSISGEINQTDKYPFACGSRSDILKGVLTDEYHPDGLLVVMKTSRISMNARSEVKVLKKNQELMREVAILSTLNHPNVVSIYGVCNSFSVDGLFAIVLPLYQNRDIRVYLKNHPEADRMRLVSEVSAGLSYLHGLTHPIVHGDIQPSNILINDDGGACICDFDRSWISDTPVSDMEMLPNCFNRYTAPELCAGTETAPPTTVESDVYALAFTVLEILTGRAPFYHIALDCTVLAAVMLGRRLCRSKYPEIGLEVWYFLEGCWAVQPHLRPASSAVARFFEVQTAMPG